MDQLVEAGYFGISFFLRRKDLEWQLVPIGPPPDNPHDDLHWAFLRRHGAPPAMGLPSRTPITGSRQPAKSAIPPPRGVPRASWFPSGDHPVVLGSEDPESGAITLNTSPGCIRKAATM
jgi:hypothetical protein